MTWKAHLSKVHEKASKRTRALCGVGLKEGVSARALLRGWDVLVRPLMEYGAEIWGEKKWEEGEKLQMDMGRMVLGVSRKTTLEVVQGERGLCSVMSRRVLLRLKFWYKIINMKKSRLIYKVYRQRREEFIKGEKKDKKNWCYWTWKALKDLHLEHIWQSEQPQLGSNFSRLVKKLIEQKAESEWQERVQKKPKLRTYRKLKSKLIVEDYVVELDLAKRRQLTMRRGGTNKLRIETGRWMIPKERVEDRQCKV